MVIYDYLNLLEISHNITKSKHKKKYYWENYHTHLNRELFEIVYIYSGNLWFSIEGTKYNVQQNDIILINNKESHKRIVIDYEVPYERFVIQFNPRIMSHLSTDEYDILSCYNDRELGTYNRIEGNLVIENKVDKYIERYKELLDNKDNKTVHAKIMVNLYKMMIKIAETYEYLNKSDYETENLQIDKRIQNILDFLKDNYDRKVTLDNLANRYNMNKYHLCHLFKEETGFSIIEYMTNKRILKSKELLDEGLKCTHVYEKVGYNDYSNFFKVFKKIVGVSPSKYKEI